jgi:hypothetical protein
MAGKVTTCKGAGAPQPLVNNGEWQWTPLSLEWTPPSLLHERQCSILADLDTQRQGDVLLHHVRQLSADPSLDARLSYVVLPKYHLLHALRCHQEVLHTGECSICASDRRETTDSLFARGVPSCKYTLQKYELPPNQDMHVWNTCVYCLAPSKHWQRTTSSALTLLAAGMSSCNVLETLFWSWMLHGNTVVSSTQSCYTNTRDENTVRA